MLSHRVPNLLCGGTRMQAESFLMTHRKKTAESKSLITVTNLCIELPRRTLWTRDIQLLGTSVPVT